MRDTYGNEGRWKIDHCQKCESLHRSRRILRLRRYVDKQSIVLVGSFRH
jgi:hypothetical protein